MKEIGTDNIINITLSYLNAKYFRLYKIIYTRLL